MELVTRQECQVRRPWERACEMSEHIVWQRNYCPHNLRITFKMAVISFTRSEREGILGKWGQFDL